MDQKLRIEVVRQTHNPQQAIWVAMHQDYSEGFVMDEKKFPYEKESGDIVVKRLLKGHRGHYGCLEHPQIQVNVGGFPHSTMQQLRTHRICSFDVQSMRYTGKRVLRLVEETNTTKISIDEKLSLIDEIFYTRPVGVYSSRDGNKYEYTEDHKKSDMLFCLTTAERYYKSVVINGYSEEHARGLLAFDFRQNFVLSCNMRALMHFLDLRWKADAQLEAQWFCDLLFEKFEIWSPEIAAWYKETRCKKARLSP